METLIQDVKYGFRMLVRSPGFTAVAVLTLALGIGANTAIFSVLDAALTRSLPFPKPDRLTMVLMTKGGEFGPRETPYPVYREWAEQQSVFASIGGYGGFGGVIAGKEGPERVDSLVVSASFFDTLGVKAALGRTFAPGEDNPEAQRSLVLSHGYWQRRFGGDKEIVGQQVVYNDEPHTIIGVLPPSFQFALTGPTEVFGQPPREGGLVTRRNLHWFNVIGRLKDGVSFEQGHAGMQSLAAAQADKYPEALRDITTRLVPLRDETVGKVKPVLQLLLGAVGLVLLIACVNVANLVLTRSVNRQREIGVRLALGAGRGRLVRQLLTESVVLALLGGALGLVLAYWGVDLLIAAIPATVLSGMPYLQNLSMDPRALIFTFSIAALSGILSGLAPALQLTSRNTYDALKQASTWSTGNRSTHRLRDALVVSQVALAVALLVGAALMIQSLGRMMQADPGFDARNLLTLRVLMPPAKYTTPEQRIVAERELRTRIGGLPGIQAVGSTSVLPLAGGSNTVRYLVEGQAAQSAGEQPEANIRSVSAGYFQALRATMRAGREFTEQDVSTAPMVVVVNRPLAEQIFPGQDAVGKRIFFTFAPDQPAREIVGVVEEVKETFLDGAPRPAIYTPFTQAPGTFRALVVRTSGPPEASMAAVRQQIFTLEPAALVFSERTMEQQVAEAPATFLRRYPALLSGIFAAVALLLSVIGIYGLLAYSVRQRTRELGIRIALGAQRRDLLRLVMGKGLRLTALGALVGLVGAFLLARAIAGMLFGVGASDAATFASVPLVMLAVALLACYIPAQRATKVDPMAALRYE